MKITIESRTPPPKINIGQETLNCQPVIDRPRQCQKCWKFGHPQRYCRNENVCVICLDTRHNIDRCPLKGDKKNPKECLNCKEKTHTALSRQCYYYTMEQEIVTRCKQQGISRKRAKDMLKEENFLPYTPYAAKARPSVEKSKKTISPARTSTGGNHNSENPSGTSTPVRNYHQNHNSNDQESEERIRIELSNRFAALINNEETSEEKEKEVVANPNENNSDPRTGAIAKTVPKPQRSPKRKKNETGNSPKNEDSKRKQEKDISIQEEENLESQTNSQLKESNTVENQDLQEMRERTNGKTENYKVNQEEEEINEAETNTNHKEIRMLDRIMREEKQREMERNLEEIFGTSPPQGPRDSLGYEFPSIEEPSEEIIAMADIVKKNIPSNIDQDQPKTKKRPASTPPEKEKTEEMSKKAKKGTTDVDGQHEDKENCGCHVCIYNEAIIKGEPKGLNNTLSESFISRMLIQKKLEKTTPLHKHKPKCFCRAHLEKNKNRPIIMDRVIKCPSPTQTRKGEKNDILTFTTLEKKNNSKTGLDNRRRSPNRDPRINRQVQPDVESKRSRSVSANRNKSEEINKISVIKPSR